MIDNQMSLVTLQKIWPLNSLISWSPGTVWRIKRMVSERRCGQSLNSGCPLLLCRHFLCDRLCYGVQGMTIHSVPTTRYEFRETISKKLVWKWNKNYVHIFWKVISDESEQSWRIFSSARLVTFFPSARNKKSAENEPKFWFWFFFHLCS